ncbi:hypothetical protein Dimus_018143 [Dionaea muscipula]
MTVIHLKKKEVVKSKVRGVEVEFDHEKLATILGIPGNNGICEYVKDVWEESKYIKPLEITRRFANNETLTAKKVKDHELPYGDWMTMVFEAFGVPLVNKKGEEPKRYDYFEETFLTMCKLRREDGSRGLSVGEKFYDVEDENRGSPEEQEETTATNPHDSARRREQGTSGVDPSGPTGREADFLKFQAEFERKRANRFHDELEKAKAENARLLALLHQAQTKPHP